uniref:Uncharacterized protein ORF 32 n=1 Tax=Bovine herpesvirus 4 TaxID=10385 RepID=G1EUR7_BHV4|nr:hypothetical protein [Bovine gammaherpesvirus 4]
MDVHINNWRFLSHRCDLLVHVVLPTQLLEKFNIGMFDNVVFYVKTRFHDGKMPTPYLKVWGLFFNHSYDFPNIDSGLALSLPIFVERDMYNPLNMVWLKVYYPVSKQTKFLSFFYMQLVQGQREGALRVQKKDNSTKNILPPISSCPFTQIYNSILESHTGIITAKNTVDVLHDMLETRPERQIKHHLALETPGKVRGTVKVEPREAAPSNPCTGELVKLQVSFRETSKQITHIARVKHIISGLQYYVCFYDSLISGDFFTFQSVLDILPQKDLAAIDPLSIILSDRQFLQTKQDGFINSLELKCIKQGFTVHQKLPILIEKDDECVELIQDHFTEACFVIRQIINPESAWIQCAISTFHGKGGCWMDTVKLWECGSHDLGQDISHLIKPGIGEQGMWEILLRDPKFKTVVCKSSHVCLVIKSLIEAWLILPGGFAIKGSYFIPEQDLELIAQRYG